MLIIAGREERDRAFVVGRASRCVNLLMQLRNRGENHRKEQRPDASSRDDRAPGTFAIREAQAHFGGESATVGPVAQARSVARQLDTAPGMAYRCDTRMIGPARIYFIIFGVLTIVGGVIGYVKAGSTASIVAGAISGIVLIVAAFLLPGNAALGLILAGVVSVLLAGRFIPHFMRSGKIMPDALMAALSVIGAVMAIVAWIKK